MTDAHFHRNGFETFLSCAGREFMFCGVHPWQAGGDGAEDVLAHARMRVQEDAHVGVGEIGLDRLKTKVVPEAQRTCFVAQLELAAECRRPVVLHGAKCWGEVVKACVPHRGAIPAFLFHGFSRSEGLLPDIFALNGFVSVGPALLNDHAVNYREMVKRLPLDRVLIETDRDWSPAVDAGGATRDASVTGGEPSQEDLLANLVRMMAELRNSTVEAIDSAVEANAVRFTETLA